MEQKKGKQTKKEIIDNIEELHKKLLLDFDNLIEKLKEHNKKV